MFLFIYFSSKLAFLSHLEMTEKQLNFDYNDFYTCGPPPPPPPPIPSPLFLSLFILSTEYITNQ